MTIGVPFARSRISVSAWESGEVDVVVYAVDQEVSRAQLGLMNLVPGHVVLTSERHPDVPEDRVLSMHSGDDADLVGVLTAAINATSRGAPAAST